MTSFSCFENKINAGLDRDLVAWEGSEKKPLWDCLENGRHLKKQKKKNKKKLAGDHNQSDQPTMTHEDSVAYRAGR